MWPWEHIAVGYLVYSVVIRLRTGRPPQDPIAVLILAIASLLPDLIDKPLAWTFGVLPTGTSLGHSILLALPLTVTIALLTWRLGSPRKGHAFAIGYLLHLPSDAVYAAVVLGATVDWQSFAWPIFPAATLARDGFLPNVIHYFGRYVAVLSGPGASSYVIAEFLLVGGSIALWLWDGAPGLELVTPARYREPNPHR